MKILTGAMLVVLMMAGEVFSQPCPDGEWCENPANGHWYRRTAAGTWQNAEDEAVQLDGHLVTVNDEAEQLWLNDNFPALGANVWIGLYQDCDDLGCADDPCESGGCWRWVSGEPVTYDGWATGEPNNANGNEDCCEMHYQSNPGAWNDGLCTTTTQTGVIERESTPIPTVSEWGLMVMAIALLTLGTLVFQYRVRAAKA
jgi:Lectin C-type domain/IPTL-CTERM motif